MHAAAPTAPPIATRGPQVRTRSRQPGHAAQRGQRAGRVVAAVVLAVSAAGVVSRSRGGLEPGRFIGLLAMYR